MFEVVTTQTVRADDFHRVSPGMRKDLVTHEHAL